MLEVRVKRFLKGLFDLHVDEFGLVHVPCLLPLTIIDLLNAFVNHLGSDISYFLTLVAKIK